MKQIRQKISTDFIRLDAFLKLTGAALTGGQAKARIQEGTVTVNGEICIQRGRKLIGGDVIRLSGEDREYLVAGASRD